MARRLAEAGVHVRDRSGQMPGVLRITLGVESQTMELLARLDRILAGMNSRSQAVRSLA
jgi:histidinol-phosphate/aromatic aminotransferase/cobyric acid decarboxylase-like protein